MDNIVRSFEEIELTEAELGLTDVELEGICGGQGFEGTFTGELFGTPIMVPLSIMGTNVSFDGGLHGYFSIIGTSFSL
jgi:uncharacterized membrane protein